MNNLMLLKVDSPVSRVCGQEGAMGWNFFTLFLFFVEGRTKSPNSFFIIHGTPQLFSCTKRGMHYSIMKRLNINRLNFECLSAESSEGSVSVTQFSLSHRNDCISLHNRRRIEGVLSCRVNHPHLVGLPF